MRTVRGILTALLLLFLIPWYYWGLLPLTTGYAYAGVLLAAGVTALGVWAVPARLRFSFVVQALLFLFLFRGWHSLSLAVFNSPPAIGKALGLVEAVGMVTVLFFLGRWTARVSPGRYALILVLSLTALVLPGSWLNEVPHLSPVWSTPPLQTSRTDNIPQVAFVPAKQGGMDLAAAVQAPWQRGKGVDPRTAQRVFQLWTYQNGTFRTAAGRTKQVAAAVRPDFTYLPVARPHFQLFSPGPGYTLKKRLNPAAVATMALDPGALSGASLGQTAGAAAAANLSWNNLQKEAGNLPAGGKPALDLLPAWQGAPYGLAGVVLRSGRLTGSYHGRSFSWPTTATRIVGVGRLSPSAYPDVVLQGLDLSAVQLGPEPKLLFRIRSNAQLPDLPRAQVQVAGIGPGPAVLLINDLESRAAVAGYAAGTAGDYRLLWQAPDHTFRFQAAGPFGQGTRPVVLALDKAPVPTLIKAPYLEALRWDGRQFVPLWHLYLPQVLFAKLAPLQGPGSQDLVFATLYGNAVGVFRPQTVPLEKLTDLATVLLTLGAWIRRLARRKGEAARA